MKDIKKVYQEIVQLLENNSDKKVKSILEQVYELCSQKHPTSTSMKNSKGEVVAVFCYYHKQWENISKVEYGQKLSNKATGLNTMCKTGTNLWTARQKKLKKVNETLINLLSSGELSVDQLEEKRKELESEAFVNKEENPPAGLTEAELTELIK
jgi:hypothetical protein